MSQKTTNALWWPQSDAERPPSAAYAKGSSLGDFFKWTFAIIGIGVGAIILLLTFAFVAMTLFGS